MSTQLNSVHKITHINAAIWDSKNNNNNKTIMMDDNNCELHLRPLPTVWILFNRFSLKYFINMYISCPCCAASGLQRERELIIDNNKNNFVFCQQNQMLQDNERANAIHSNKEHREKHFPKWLIDDIIQIGFIVITWLHGGMHSGFRFILHTYSNWCKSNENEPFSIRNKKKNTNSKLE